MSRSTRLAAALASLGALAAIGAPAASAATPVNLDFACKFPVVGTQTVQFRAAVDLLPGSAYIPATTFNASVSVGDFAAGAFEAVDQLDAISSVTAAESPSRGAALTGQLHGAGGAPVPLRWPLDVGVSGLTPPVPGQPALTGTGTTASLFLGEPGTQYALELTGLELNLRARLRDGSAATELRTPATNVDGDPYADIDGDPTTFNVPCKRASAPTRITVSSPPQSFRLKREDVGLLPPKPAAEGTYMPEDFTCDAVRVRWSKASARERIAKYVVKYDGGPAGGVTVDGTATSALVTGLQPGTSYAFRVTAWVAALGQEVDSEPFTQQLATAAPCEEQNSGGDDSTATTPADHAYGLLGSTALKGLSRGSFGLTGALTAHYPAGGAAGAVTGELALGATSGRLMAYGWLPLTTRLAFTPAGTTTGSFADGVLRTSSSVRVNVKSVKLFGVIQLGGGTTCRTASPAALSLKSAPGFTPAGGGALTGTYALGPLTGCGPLTGMISRFIAGASHTIGLKLQPTAPAAT